jgi:Domain of unknown function (DUF4388)
MATPQPNIVKTLPTGFQAQIRGASLWDLVQIECLARKHRVVRVTTVGNVGYLYFDAGNIVHAATLEQEGEFAAFEMLQWNQGTFEGCDRAWPASPSITVSWQALLLRAAQIKDEQGRGKVVPLPSKERTADLEGGAVTVESPMSTKPPQGNESNGNSGSWHAEDFELAVRLGANGEVFASRGDAEEFANIAAYTSRLAEILGDFMGLEGFRGLECTFKKGRCLLLKESDGNILAVKPSAQADVSLIKDRIGL